MTIFTIEINDETHLAGISAARTAYNSVLSATIKDEYGDDIANPELISTDGDYVQFVMSRAAESYAKQYGV
jgi:hypothetical protein